VPRYTDGQIIDALTRSRGMVYVAARLLDCSPLTIKKRIEVSDKVRETVDAQAELFVDTAELKLIESVNNGDSWAIQFALKTKGRSRGYVERQEISGPDGGAIPLTAVPYAEDELEEWRQRQRRGLQNVKALSG
jgi:hypothetical protein